MSVIHVASLYGAIASLKQQFDGSRFTAVEYMPFGSARLVQARACAMSGAAFDRVAAADTVIEWFVDAIEPKHTSAKVTFVGHLRAKA